MTICVTEQHLCNCKYNKKLKRSTMKLDDENTINFDMVKQMTITSDSDLTSGDEVIVSYASEHYIIQSSLKNIILKYQKDTLLTDDDTATLNEFLSKVKTQGPTKPEGFIFNFTVINKDITSKISSFLSFLLSKTLFIPMIVVCLLGVYLTINDYQYFFSYGFSLSSSDYILALVVYTLSVLFHEFGHAIACKKYGGDVGGIGFGLYYVFPVFFANVNQSWLLNKLERCKIGMAGIYLQLCYLVLVLLFAEILNSNALYFSCTVILFSMAMTVNPIFKFDGYWVLVDYLGVKNLKVFLVHAFQRNGKLRDVLILLTYLSLAILQIVLLSIFITHFGKAVITMVSNATNDIAVVFASIKTFAFFVGEILFNCCLVALISFALMMMIRKVCEVVVNGVILRRKQYE